MHLLHYHQAWHISSQRFHHCPTCYDEARPAFDSLLQVPSKHH